MAQLYDTLGRLVENQKTTNLTLDQIKGLISASAKSAVGKATPFAKSGNNDSSDKLLKVFEKYTKDFQKVVQEQKDYLRSMVDILKDRSDAKKQIKEQIKDQKKREKNTPKVSVWKNLDKFSKAATRKGSAYTHDTHVEAALKDMAKILADMARGADKAAEAVKAVSKGGGNGGSGGGGGGIGVPAPGGGEEQKKQKELDDRQRRLKESIRESSLKNILGTIQKQILGYDVMGTVLEGVLDKEREFVQEARKAAYEIEGATKGSQGLLRTFENINKTTKLTGKDRQKFIDRYLKTTKMGFKDQKKVHALTVAQLNTEEQLGMEADALGDTFVDWSRGLKFNEGQISEMGRGMRDVARFTGLTGDSLKEVVESSKTYVDNLKNAGIATTASVKNMIELSANFKKTGIDGGKIMDAMSGTNKLLEASNGTFGLLAKAASQAGVYGKLFAGTITQSKSAMKGMNREFMRTINQFGVAGNSAEEIRKNWEQLSDDAKARINIQLKGAFDMEAGELMGTIETFENATETLSDKLAKTNKKLNENITLEEKTILLEEQRKLKLSASMNALTAIDEAAKGAKNMGEALGKFGERRKEFESDMSALGIAWTNETDVARGAIEQAMAGVNKSLKESGKQELSIDSSEIERALKDPTAFRELTSKLSKAEQEASTAAKAQLDPLSQSAQYLKEMNDTLRNLANGGFSSIFSSSLGSMLVWLAVIAGGALGIWQIITQLKLLGEDILRAYDPSKYAKELQEVVTPYWDSSSPIGKMAHEATEKNSIYTHDTHVEKLMSNALNVLEQIKSCVCSTSQNPTGATSTAAGGTDAQKATGAAPATSVTPGATPDMDDSAIQKVGKQLKKNAVAIAILAIGVVAVGIALVFLAKTVLGGLGLDLASVVSTAAVIAAIIGAVVAIFEVAQKAEEWLKEMQNNPLMKNPKALIKPMIKGAVGLLLFGTALILIGAALMWITKKLLGAFGMDAMGALELAGVITAIITSLGIIATAAIVSAAIFAGIGYLLPGLAWTIPLMAMGAAALALLVPVMLATGLVIIKLAQATMALMGIDGNKASEIAKSVSGVIGAVGSIAASVLWSYASLALLGAAMPVILLAENLMWAGAIGLMLLTPAIMSIASAIVGLAAMTSFSAQTAQKVNDSVTATLNAAGSIAQSILWSYGQLALLGTAMPYLLMATPLMYTGASGLLFLTPAILSVASAIIGMSYLIAVSPKIAQKVEQSVTSTMDAAGAISRSILMGMASLALLGALVTTPLFWISLVFMGLGAVALLALAPVMMGLVNAIIGMSSMLPNVKNSKTLMKKLTAISQLIDSTGKILNDVMNKLVPFTQSGWFTSSPAKQIKKAIPILKSLFSSLVGLSWSIILGTLMFGNIKLLEGAAKRMEVMSDMFNKTANAIKSLAETMKVFDGDGILWGQSDATKISNNQDKFFDWFWSVATFVRFGIVWPVSRLPASKVLDEAAKKMSALSSLLGNTKSALESLAIIMKVFDGDGLLWGQSDATKIAENKDRFAAWFKSVAIFVRDGIVKPVIEIFTEPKILRVAADIMQNMEKTIKTIPPIITNLGSTMDLMFTDWGYQTELAKKIFKNKDSFRDYFYAIGTFVRDGIVNPIINIFKDSKRIREAASIMRSMEQSVKSIPPVFHSLASAMGLISNDDVETPVDKIVANKNAFAVYFSEIAKFIRDGIVNPVISEFGDSKGIDKAARILRSVNSVTKDLPNIISNLGKALNDGVLSSIDSKLPATDKLEASAKKITALVEILVGLKVALQALSDVMSSVRGMDIDINSLKDLPLAELASIGIQSNAATSGGESPTERVQDERIARKTQESAAFVNKELGRFVVQATSPGSGIYIKQAEQTTGNRLEQERATSLAMRAEGVRTITNPQVAVRLPQKDVHDQVRQNAVSSEPSASQVSSPELSQIAKAATEEADSQKQMIMLLEEMLKIFKGESTKAGNSGANVGDTAANKVGQKPNNYYRWHTGNQFQQGAKQVLNVGAGII